MPCFSILTYGTRVLPWWLRVRFTSLGENQGGLCEDMTYGFKEYDHDNIGPLQAIVGILPTNQDFGLQKISRSGLPAKPSPSLTMAELP